MRTPLNFSLIFTALAVLAIGAKAQEPDPETMKKMMPGEMHALLAKHVGNWTVTVKFRMAEGAEMMDGEADCRAEMVLDGRFLKKTYKSEVMGTPFTVEQILGYDGFREHFFEFTTESMSTSYMIATGKLSEDKKTLTLLGEGPDPETGKMVKHRVVYRLVSDDEYVVEWWEPTKDGKEEVSVRLTHKRKKG